MSYRTPRDNIVKDFLNPLLSNASTYKRAVGFFSSSSLIQVSYGINKLVNNCGKVMLIASPRLTEDDIEAINKGYDERKKIIENALLRDFNEPKDYFEERRLNLLAHLIKEGVLDIKIALLQSNSKIGLFHDKLGIIEDNEGNIVAFSGSLNETEAAFVLNYEAIDVFASWWSEESRKRVEEKNEAFNRMWKNTEDEIQIMDFPEVVKNKLVSYKREIVDIYFDDFDEDKESGTGEREDTYKQNDIPTLPRDLNFHEYQKEAINNWKLENFKGIFDMATGTGKTYTGLGALLELYKYCNGKLAVIICCPYQHLVDQWVEDLEYFNINPIIGYSTSQDRHYKKRLRDSIFDYNLGIKKFLCFICTNSTFRIKSIQREINTLTDNVLIIVDEAHNFGAEKLFESLPSNIRYRLALSATLERHNDEEGTERLYKYFGKKCIEYTLERAIEEKKLTPYYYYPVVVTLSTEERNKYTEITNEIVRCITYDKRGKLKLTEKGKMLALKRSRVVAGAIEKASQLYNIMKNYTEETHILVYCGATKLLDQEYEDDDIEDIRQIDYITKILGNDLDMKVAQFTSREDSEKRRIRKKAFMDGDIQALIAIKCLDEGVNIPKIKTAFILASTTNPKEYIQRRGRVLRMAKGKEYARIYDFITLPHSLEEVMQLTYTEMQKDKSLVKKEIKRMIEFKSLALNPYDSDDLLEEINEKYRLYEDDMNYEDDIEIEVGGDIDGR